MQKSIDYDIGFEDSEILSYCSKNDLNVLILHKCWNEEILSLEFFDCMFFSIKGSWEISDVCVSTQSPLLDKVLEEVYEIMPTIPEYKLFQFFNFDEPNVNIVCKKLIISSERFPDRAY